MRQLTIVALAFFLAACGFHLRGQGPGGQFPYSAVYVSGTGPVAAQLRQNLQLLGNVSLVAAARSGVAQVDVSNERTDRKVGALNSDGRVSEYRMFYVLTYRIIAPGGEELAGNSELRLFRDYTYDENNALGNEAQEQMLIRDMHQGAAQQILRRTAALARQAASTQPTPAPTPQPGLLDAR
ncbi:MAG TPA: LPS assembly lipoprotein LptE [Chitinolyticbacter sp.]|nr:LPS assembly lipoprotein LptE [Chitinolyticbacter sp.]